MPMTMAERLRQLMRGDQLVVAPGAFNPMSAMLVERAGFECVYMTGGGTGLGLGVPDVGLLTMTEMVDAASLITDAIGIPVISDADNGYGNVANVWRTVRAFEKAGVAGIHLEDQVFPKRCGNLRGKELVGVDEMVQKIRAARDARRSPDFMIFARCDAILVSGFDDAMQRARAYVAAGADGLFIETIRSLDQMELIGKSFDVPLMYNASPSGKNVLADVAEVQRRGFKVMIVPITAQLAAIKALQDAYAEIKATGSTKRVVERGISYEDFHELAGLKRIEALYARYEVDSAAPTI